MAVGAIEAGDSRDSAIRTALVRLVLVTFVPVAFVPVTLVIVAVMVVMPEHRQPEDPGPVRPAAGMRITGVANLLATLARRPVRRARRHRERENRLGGDHEAGGDAAKRGHGDGSEGWSR